MGSGEDPDSFGALGGKILVGNFGDGRIPAYDPITGTPKNISETRTAR
jgi:hypothetical protein